MVSAAARKFYGRRQGRPLRSYQQRLLEELLPQIAIPDPSKGRIAKPDELFSFAVEEVWLEIGFGGGEHLFWQAMRQAETGGAAGLLGVEFFVNGVAKLLRQAEGTAALERLRLHHGDALDLLEALPDASLDRVFILFPDPWPKLRHHKRRIVQKSNLDSLARIMKDGAELRIASDDPGYQEWILLHLMHHPAFEWTARGARDWLERPADWPQTRYEKKALAAGRRPIYLSYERKARRCDSL